MSVDTVSPTITRLGKLDRRWLALLRGELGALWRVLRLTIASVVVPVVAGVGLCALPQGLETLRVVADEYYGVGAAQPNVHPWVALLIAVAIAGLAAWCCARVTLYLFDPRRSPGHEVGAWAVARRRCSRIWSVQPERSPGPGSQ
jgi:hypothetical protein